MNITCEYCGNSIDIEKYKKCENCGNYYDNNKTYLELKNLHNVNSNDNNTKIIKTENVKIEFNNLSDSDDINKILDKIDNNDNIKQILNGINSDEVINKLKTDGVAVVKTTIVDSNVDSKIGNVNDIDIDSILNKNGIEVNKVVINSDDIKNIINKSHKLNVIFIAIFIIVCILMMVFIYLLDNNIINL